MLKIGVSYKSTRGDARQPGGGGPAAQSQNRATWAFMVHETDGMFPTQPRREGADNIHAGEWEEIAGHRPKLYL